MTISVFPQEIPASTKVMAVRMEKSRQTQGKSNLQNVEVFPDLGWEQRQEG